MGKELKLATEIAEPGAKKMLEFSLADSDLETQHVIGVLIRERLISYEEAKLLEGNRTNLDRCRGLEYLHHHSEMELYNLAIIKGAPFTPIQEDIMNRFHGVLKKGGHLIVELDTQRPELLSKRYSASFFRPIERYLEERYHRRKARKMYESVMKRIGFRNFKNYQSLLIAEKN